MGYKHQSIGIPFIALLGAYSFARWQILSRPPYRLPVFLESLHLDGFMCQQSGKALSR